MLNGSIERKRRRKGKKRKEVRRGLLDLRRRTRESVSQTLKDQEHKHIFGITEDVGDGMGGQVCHECGFTIDVEIIK